jgi:4-amino-4-deoxy-L-arabinose transferase-like glycosyltransferase
MESGIAPDVTHNLVPSSILSPAARILWILLIVVTLYISYFRNLGVVGLVGPDEPRYAWIAREMAESHDWVTPRLYGQPWFEKPVLYYWSAGLCFKLLWVSETSARLPGAFFALVATLALAWLARRLYGWETAGWLLLLLPTTVGMIGFSHAGATDMPFAAMFTVAMVFAACLLKLVKAIESSILPAIAFGVFLGLAVLAKGPAALILSGGAVLIWAAITKRWKDALRCLHPAAVASFCLTALPWYVLCARRNPDFLRVFIIEHNFKRFLTPEFQHIQPFWFYLPVLLIAFVPWTLALLWSTVVGALQLRNRARYSDSTVFFLAWAVFCLFFFSISKSKLPGYILPAIPAIGLLLARSIVALGPGREKSFQGLLIAGSLLASGISVFVWFARPAVIARTSTHAVVAQINTHALLAGCWILLLLAFANLLLGLTKVGKFDGSPLCVVPVLLLLLLFPRVARSFVPQDPSGKTLAREILANKIPVEQIQVVAMPRGQQFSLNFYLHHEIATWDAAAPKVGMLLTRTNRCDVNLQLPWICINEPLKLPASGWYIFPIDRLESMQGLDDLGRSAAGSALRGRKPR